MMNSRKPSESPSALSRAETLAPDVKSGRVNGTQVLREEFPWVTDDLAARAIQQGIYFHWRDTGE